MTDQSGPQLDLRSIRLLADGELDAAQTQALAARLAADDAVARSGRSQLECERRLREAVHRTMSMDEARAPVALRTSVTSILARDLAEPATSRKLNTGPTRTRRDEQSVWRRFFASPQRANVLAVAAVLALIVGAVLFGIFGRTIDEAPPRGSGRQALDLVANAATYVDSEHGLCSASRESLQSKITYSTPQQAERELTSLLGEPVRVFDLSALGYEFIGASKCDVPLEEHPSGHLLYRKASGLGDDGPMVSVFMAPARGGCQGICKGLKLSQWALAAVERCQHRVLYSTDGRMIYFLVCCSDKDVDAVAQRLSEAQVAGVR